MQPAFMSSFDVHAFGTRKLAKGAPLNVRAWTGRSALSLVTTTARPALATAGAGKTRVSEMRDSAGRTPLARPAHRRMKPRHSGPVTE
jgi:hypothetical protein